MKQIRNRGIRLARSQKGPYTTKIGNRMYARAVTMRPPREGSVIPDNLWTIEDSGTCSISNNVITWNRLTADSFIRLTKPASLQTGQTWVLSYTVLVDSGVGQPTTGLFCSSASTINPSGVNGTEVQDYKYEYLISSTAPAWLLRWTPSSIFNNNQLQIRDVRVYDKNNPGAYP